MLVGEDGETICRAKVNDESLTLPTKLVGLKVIDLVTEINNLLAIINKMKITSMFFLICTHFSLP
jgi:hypothetical protein